MRVPYRANPKAFEDYYLHQVGNGMRYYTGVNRQAGHGIGNIFKGLFRAAVPLLSSGAKVVGKQLLRTGLQVAGDVASGRKPKEAIKTRARAAGKQLLGQIAQRGNGRVQRKRKSTAATKHQNRYMLNVKGRSLRRIFSLKLSEHCIVWSFH